MKINSRMLPYLLINAATFYLAPLLIQDTGTAMVFLLVGIPAICLVTAILFGRRYSFHWLYPIGVALLFASTVFIFYNKSAWVYIISYGLIALAGNVICALLLKSKQ